MSRRPPGPGADRTEQNRATLKQLVKLESNKSCADCKRNKHPRWASWNIGVFVCIRCSGIHRGMGTHISRVKSVDLDSWTDEQMQSMLRWGNARANRYWEAKLAEGHVPNEAKIENFIRTKYDSKRWVMDGPMPEPETLDVEGESRDDDVPLNVVREKVVGERERGESMRNGSGGVLAQPPGAGPRVRPQDVDLFGDPGPARPSTTEPAVQRPGVQKAPAAPPKQTKPGESLLGLDFFGGTQSAPPARPSSTGGSTPGVPGRADLKSSILSLYASKPAAPAQPPQQQQQTQSNVDMFGGMQSPGSPSQAPSNSAFGGMNDAFGSLSFASPQQTQAKPTPFSNFSPPAGHARQPSATKPSLSGGSFFDAKPPAAPPKSNPQQARKESFGGDFGDFSSAASPPLPTSIITSARSPPAATSSMGDLFDMSPPMPTAAPTKPTTTSPPPIQPQQQRQPSYSAFNLSQPAPPPPPKQASPPQTSTLSNFSNLNNMDAWGSNDAWATPDPAPASQPAPIQTATNSMASPTMNFKPAPPAPSASMQTPFDSGWGDTVSPPSSTTMTTGNAGFGGGMGATTTSAGGFSVQQDEEFGGWSHASPVAQTPGGGGAGAKQGSGFGGAGGSDDLFGNVWE